MLAWVKPSALLASSQGRVRASRTKTHTSFIDGTPQRSKPVSHDASISSGHTSLPLLWMCLHFSAFVIFQGFSDPLPDVVKDRDQSLTAACLVKCTELVTALSETVPPFKVATHSNYMPDLWCCWPDSWKPPCCPMCVVGRETIVITPSIRSRRVKELFQPGWPLHSQSSLHSRNKSPLQQRSGFVVLAVESPCFFRKA